MKMKKKMTGEIEKRDMKVVQGEREPTSIVHINRTSRKIGGEWGEATIKRYRAKARTTATAHKGFFGSFPLSKDGAVPGRLATTAPGHHHHHGVFLSLDATVGAALSRILTYDARNNSSTSVHERRRCRCGGCVIAVSRRLSRFPLAREG